MLVSNTILRDNTLSNVSNSIAERPRILVDLNETHVRNLEIETNLPFCFNSPPNINCHIETKTDDIKNFSQHVESTIVTSYSALLEDDEMKFVISSFHEELRGLSSIVPTNLEQEYALRNLEANAHKEFNKMFFSTITPSKITTKRRRSFLSPINKKKKCGRDIK